jgi:predicted GNAT family acetyltransferase
VESEPQLNIVDNPERGRYEAFLGEEKAGYSEYVLRPGRVVFTHTVVRPKFEGHGIGSRLAKFVIEDVRARGLRITPVCPFVRAYLRRHSEYDAIVDFPPEGSPEERVSSL